MYYKIEDKESDLYKALYELRTLEKELPKANCRAIAEFAGSDFKLFYGYAGQQNFSRSWEFNSFMFLEPEKLKEPKAWIESNGYYKPNKRTKAGRKTAYFIESLPKSSVFKLLNILKLQVIGRFNFPFLEIGKDEVIILRLDDRFSPHQKELIEITSLEFDKLLN